MNIHGLSMARFTATPDGIRNRIQIRIQFLDPDPGPDLLRPGLPQVEVKSRQTGFKSGSGSGGDRIQTDFKSESKSDS